MFMILRKKQMIMTALVIMFGIAGYLNYRYDSAPNEKAVVSEEITVEEPGIGETVMVSADAKKTENDFFALQRLERDKARSKMYDELKAMLSDNALSEEAREQTEAKLTELISREEKEVSAENVLVTKGFNDVMVSISDESITVNINRKGISRSDTAKIVDTIYEITQNNNIKIVEVE